MSDEDKLQRVDLETAWTWECPTCGADNYEQGNTVKVEDLPDGHELRDMIQPHTEG